MPANMLNSQSANATYLPSSWQANLYLKFEKTHRGARLTKNEHQGPLSVQKPFYPEGPDLPHVYLLHPPGGLVSGDSLTIDIDVGTGSSSLLTAPGAFRVYKAREDRTLQKQVVTINLSENSSAEWLPQESIYYPDSFSEVNTIVNLPKSSDNNCHFIGWEIACYGLSEKTAPFLSGSVKQSLEIWQDKLPVLIDKFSFDGSDKCFKQTMTGLQGKNVNGIMVSGPFNEELVNGLSDQQWLNDIRNITHSNDVLFSSTLRGQWLITRYLGNNAEQARQLMTEVWKVVRPILMNRKAVLPRIWSC